MSSDHRKMLLVNWSAYTPTHPAGTPNPAATHAPGRPPDTFVLDDTMLKNHASGRLKAVSPMRRVRFADVDDAEDTDSDDLEDFIAEMTRRFDAEVDAFDPLAQYHSSLAVGPAKKERLVSGGATFDSDESDTDFDVNPGIPDCERSDKAKVKIYAPFLSLCLRDMPGNTPTSSPENIRVNSRTDVVKGNCNPRQWMAVSSADRVPKITDLTVGCDGPRLPPRYPD